MGFFVRDLGIEVDDAITEQIEV